MPDGNSAQTRIVAEQVAEATVTHFVSQHPELRQAPQIKAELPPPMKWAAGIIAAVFTMGIGAMAVWLVTTVNTMQVTLARMDERMSTGAVKDSRFDELERRVNKNETAIAEMRK